MTQRQDDTAIMTILEIINSNGFEGLGDAVAILINEAIRFRKNPWEWLKIKSLFPDEAPEMKF